MDLSTLIPTLLTSGIVGTTLSITILSILFNNEFEGISTWLLPAAFYFSASSLTTLFYLTIMENSILLDWSLFFLLCGVFHIFISTTFLFKLIITIYYARMTRQLFDIN
jgi:hypothetical protein